MRARASFALAVTAALALSVHAEGWKRDLVDSWKDRMADSEAALKAEDYAAALRLADRTVGEMVERLGPGQGSTSLFTNALLHKALAHAGAGEVDEALWYWHILAGLDPTVVERDLSEFGKPGRVLRENVEPRGLTSTVTTDEGPIDPPKVVKQKKPKFPHGAHYFGVTGELVVEVIVAADGSIRAPRIVSPLPAATLSYAALEAVKRWRFEPARVRERPVDIVFNLTVKYKG